VSFLAFHGTIILFYLWLLLSLSTCINDFDHAVILTGRNDSNCLVVFFGFAFEASSSIEQYIAIACTDLLVKFGIISSFNLRNSSIIEVIPGLFFFIEAICNIVTKLQCWTNVINNCIQIVSIILFFVCMIIILQMLWHV